MFHWFTVPVGEVTFSPEQEEMASNILFWQKKCKASWKEPEDRFHTALLGT